MDFVVYQFLPGLKMTLDKTAYEWKSCLADPNDMQLQGKIDEFFAWQQINIHACVDGIYEQKVTIACDCCV